MNIPTMQSQRGAMALLISLILLTLITMVSLYTAHTVSMEQKISTNDTRSRMAFEAAEAGLYGAMAYVDTSNGGPDRDEDGDVTDELIYLANGQVAINNSAVVTTGVTNTLTLPNGSSATVSLTTNADMTEVDIVSVGVSDDGAATRTIEFTVALVDPVPNVPDNPFTGHGGVVVNGSATIYNPEGYSTIWTGADVDLSGNASTSTHIVRKKPSSTYANNHPECLGGLTACDDGSTYYGCPDTEYVKCETVSVSDQIIVGVDVIEHDSSLTNLTADQFFQNTFGMTKAAFRESMVKIEISGANYGSLYDEASPSTSGADNAGHTVIWVEGDVTDAAVVGCVDDGAASAPNVTSKNNPWDRNCEAAGGKLEPSIVIVNGDFNANGGTIFGLLYVIGGVDTGGSPEIQGAMMIEDQNVTMTGSLTIWYDSSILRGLNQAGSLGGSAGTWKDF